MKSFLRDQLQVMIYDHRAEMGKAAAEDGAEAIREVIRRKGYANVMFAAAHSQLELLDGLVHSDVTPDIGSGSRENGGHAVSN